VCAETLPTLSVGKSDSTSTPILSLFLFVFRKPILLLGFLPEETVLGEPEASSLRASPVVEPCAADRLILQGWID